MGKKWVIVAAVVFLGVVCWVVVGYEPKSYTLGQIHSAIKGLQSDDPEEIVIVDIGSKQVYPRPVRFQYLRSSVQWFREKIGLGAKGGIGSWDIADYVETYRIRYSSGDIVVAVYWTFESVEKTGKACRVSRVEVRPDASCGLQADEVRSELRKQFPGLGCQIVEP